MTRHILTTATLVAFLAAGHAPIPASEGHRPIGPAAPSSVVPSAPIRILGLDEHLIAVSVHAVPQALDVALQLEADHAPSAIRLWAGRKNGWGSLASRALPVAGLPGFHRALVALPEALPDSARLWLGVERGDRRAALAAIPFRIA